MATILINETNINNFRNLALNHYQYKLLVQLASKTNNMEVTDDVIFTRMFVSAVKLELQTPNIFRNKTLNEAIQNTLLCFDIAKKENNLKGWRNN